MLVRKHFKALISTVIRSIAPAALLSICCQSTVAQPTAFNYQGRLNDGGVPANGVFDITFSVWNSASGPAQIGTNVTNIAVGVSNGLFTTAVDFGGNIFTGLNLWLELGVRTNGGGAFSTLLPRQALSSTPYALTALSVASGGLATGTYANALALTNAGNSLSGNGAGLTGLNASQLLTGTVADARLSSNVALLNANQTFSGIDTFLDARGKFTGDGANLRNINLSLNSGRLVRPLGIFNPPVTMSVSAPRSSIAAADINGDGRMDLVTASFSVNGFPTTNAFVMTNTGLGGFIVAAAPVVDFGPRVLVASDINSDGWPDLISVNYTAGNLSVLTNNRSGGFVLASSPAVGTNVETVTVADVNGDGRPDLISGYWPGFGSGMLVVLTNTGSGGIFTQALALSLGLDTTVPSIAAADLNGDGRVDLVTANQAANKLSVLTNNGSGGFALASVPTVGPGRACITAADVNGDGRMDLISASSSSNSLWVLTNNGNAEFALASTLAVGAYPEAVAAVDLNGDGKVDLVSVNEASATLSVFTNNGSGGFGLIASPPVAALPESLAIADLNGDGGLDLVVTHANTNLLSLVFNKMSFDGTLGGVIFVASNGNVGIGTTSPQVPLHVMGDSTNLRLDNPISGQYWNIYTERHPNPAISGNLLFFPGPGGVYGYIRRTDGNYFSSSDARLKEDICELDDVLERVLRLRPVSYRFKSMPASASRSLGLIAQEVEPLFPEAVSEHEGMKALAYSELVPVTVSAIQELNHKLEKQLQQKETEITELKRNVEELSELVDSIARKANKAAK